MLLPAFSHRLPIPEIPDYTLQEVVEKKSATVILIPQGGTALRDDEGSRKLLTRERTRFFAEFTVSLFATLRAIRSGANRLRMTLWNPFATTCSGRSRCT
jgi:hypothetical protein